MSVIRAQAFRFSIINYLATALAAISTLWIYPLDFDAYGLAQFLVSMAFICIPLATMGTLTLVIRFFPEYDALGYRKSYLFNVLVMAFGSLAIAALLAILVNQPVLKFLEFLNFDAHLVAKHKFTIAILIAIMLYNSVLIMHASNYKKIAIPSAYHNLLPKFTLPVLVIAVYTQVIDMALFARLWVLSFGIASVGLTLYLSRINALDLKPELHFFRWDRLRTLLSYSGHVGAGTMGNLLVGRIDVIMIGTLIGLKETGLYVMALFIGNVLSIPTTAIWQISSPVLTEAFEKKDWPRITDVYKKSSTNLSVVGVFIFFLILGNLDAVLHLSPKYEEMSSLVPLFAIIGLSKLIDMATSVNHQILMFSTKYRSVTVFVVGMILGNGILNYVLIMGIGALGAALATCITMYFYQVAKCLYIDRVFRIHPFSRETLLIGILFLTLVAYTLLLPGFGAPFVDAIIFTAGLCVLYIGGIRLLHIRSDVTEMAFGYLYKFTGLFPPKA